MSSFDPPAPRSAKSIAVENAANDFIRGDDVQERCPECQAILEVKVIRPDVIVRCPNGHIDAHRSIKADPGWAMRLGFIIAIAIILGLGLVRKFYFEGRPDPQKTQYFDNPNYDPSANPAPTIRDRRNE